MRKTNGVIYLAAPYMHPEARIIEMRTDAMAQVTVGLVNNGYLVFAPCIQGRALQDQLNWDHTQWLDFDKRFILAACSMVMVANLPGWGRSRGVKEEMAFAHEHGIPLAHLSCSPFVEQGLWQQLKTQEAADTAAQPDC